MRILMFMVVMLGALSRIAAVSAQECIAWHSAEVTGRQGHGLAYDKARHRMVLFGGHRGETPPGTWEFDGKRWFWMHGSQPAGLEGISLAYDEIRDETVLFGGVDSHLGFRAETWAWDGARWFLRETAGPSPRTDHRMAYDSARGVIVLFGGYGNQGHNSETWEWDGAAWTLRATTGPAPRSRHGLAYDAYRGVTVLFGGKAGVFFGDTWEWNGSDWSLRAQDGPPPASAISMAYDAGRKVTTLIGTWNGRGMTWEWDGDVWTRVAEDAPRKASSGAAAFDADRGIVFYVTGGWPSEYSAQTWGWDGSAWTLHTPQRASRRPSARADHAMAYDRFRDATVMFGGGFTCVNENTCNRGEYRYIKGDTWELDGSGWKKLHPDPREGPMRRSCHAMTFDPDRRMALLFGGKTLRAGFSNELWGWDGQRWTLLSQEGPSPRVRPAMTYDERRGVLVLFGGGSEEGPTLADTWEWDGTQWFLRSEKGPVSRVRHTLVYDSVRGVNVLFGGSSTKGPRWLGDTWEWDGVDWVQRSTSGPSARSSHSMVFNTGRGTTVLYGGVVGQYDSGNPITSSETWEWDGAAWSLLGSEVMESRFRHAMAYDETNGDLVVFAGWYGPQEAYSDITWLAGRDCNCNERPDRDEILDGTEADGNSNGVPDSCER
ncbi:MAG: hypothetical protein IT449_03265 [Phycisphaerales bacterium]|nr:hypothetical protein [Phycisphaerales bacterium]